MTEQPDGTAPPPSEAPRVTADEIFVVGADTAFFLAIKADGTTEMRAKCSPEQAVYWLENLLAAIKDSRIAPREGRGVVEL